jgi:hypothetical protein
MHLPTVVDYDPSGLRHGDSARRSLNLKTGLQLEFEFF